MKGEVDNRGLNFLKNARKRLTKREFFMLTGLALLLEVFSLANYFLIPKWNEYQDTVNTLKNNNSILEFLEKEYARKSTFDEELSFLQYQYNKLHESLPTYVRQEDIILTVWNFAEESNMYLGNMSFGTLNTVAAPEAADLSAAGDKAIVLTQEITLNFSGSYASLYKFLRLVENSTKMITMKELSLARIDNIDVKGTMKLQFNGYLDEGEKSDFQIIVPESAKKLSPFEAYDNYGHEDKDAKGEETIQKIIDPDFYILINNFDDNAPKIIVGEYPRAESEIYSNSNDTIKGKITISGEEGNYSYSYTLGNETRTLEKWDKIFPDGVIRIEVVSQKRKSNEDNVKLEFDIENKTDKVMNVNIRVDDSVNPRFEVGSTVGDVVINKLY